VPDRQQTPADPGTAFQLGKIEGQLRELIHQNANEAMKNTARDEKLAKLSNVPDDIAAIKIEVAALKTDRDRRDGAMGLGSWLARSPLVTWIALIALAVWTWLKGHAQ
jgi:hypothetical protein